MLLVLLFFTFTLGIDLAQEHVLPQAAVARSASTLSLELIKASLLTMAYLAAANIGDFLSSADITI